MEVVGAEFREKVMDCKDNWFPARAVVQRALESRFQVNNIITRNLHEEEFFGISISHLVKHVLKLLKKAK